jgi:hypothetical protein
VRGHDYPGWRILPAWRCPADQPSRLTSNPGTAALAIDDPGFPQDLQGCRPPARRRSPRSRPARSRRTQRRGQQRWQQRGGHLVADISQEAGGADPGNPAIQPVTRLRQRRERSRGLGITHARRPAPVRSGGYTAASWTGRGAGVLGNLVDRPLRPRQVGQPQMPERMRGQPGHPGPLGDPGHDVRPARSPQRRDTLSSSRPVPPTAGAL